MSTEFLYREKDCSGCEMKSYSLQSLGGNRSGPRTLGPERLQWLTTSAANRQVFMRNTLWSLGLLPALRRGPKQKQTWSGHRAIWSSGRSGLKPQNAAFQKGASGWKAEPFPCYSSPRRKSGPIKSPFMDSGLRRNDGLRGTRANFHNSSNHSRANALSFTRILIGVKLGRNIPLQFYFRKSNMT